MEELGENLPEMTFEVATSETGTAVVTVSGELDLGNVERLAAAVSPVIEGGAARLVVNLSGLRFADSSAIALWVRWAKSVSEIELRDPSPLLRRVLTTMGLAETLHVTP
jgi:anti-sigma B factor antagonist